MNAPEKPTPTIDDIKAYGRKIAKGTGMNQNAAREAAATKFGYRNFAEAQREIEGTITNDGIRKLDGQLAKYRLS